MSATISECMVVIAGWRGSTTSYHLEQQCTFFVFLYDEHVFDRVSISVPENGSGAAGFLENGLLVLLQILLRY